MTETPTERRRRLRLLTIGEVIAVIGLAISGLALWNSWDEGKGDKPAIAVEKQRSVPIALRGKVDDAGKALILSPVEAGHALDSATLTAAGKSLEIGSDGRVSAADLEKLVDAPRKDAPRAGSQPITVQVRYIEAGTDKTGSGHYRLSYRWEDGGLFHGRSLRVTGWRRG